MGLRIKQMSADKCRTPYRVNTIAGLRFFQDKPPEDYLC